MRGLCLHLLGARRHPSSYEQGDRDHVTHSLNFFVNFLAIFRRMLEVSRLNVKATGNGVYSASFSLTTGDGAHCVPSMLHVAQLVGIMSRD